MTKQYSRRQFGSLFAVAAAGAAVGCSTSGGGSNSKSLPTSGQSMADLVAAAKKEGTVSWLESQPASFAAQAAAAFKKEYGITVQYSAINDTPLEQQYFGAAQAGKIATDVVLESAQDFYDQGKAKGWVQSITDAGLPVLQGGEYPSKYVSDGGAVVLFSPFLFFYNKNELSAADAPKSLEDMANPKYKGMINIPDVKVANPFVQFFDAMHQKYGDAWFKGVVANNPKVYPAVSAGAQAVAAGDGAIIFPAVHSVGVPIIAAGGPLVEVTPAYTSGPEAMVYLTAYDKAPHPNAAKLFANWLLTKAGNTAAVGELAISPYATKGFPQDYVPFRPFTTQMQTQIVGLLGSFA